MPQKKNSSFIYMNIYFRICWQIISMATQIPNSNINGKLSNLLSWDHKVTSCELQLFTQDKIECTSHKHWMVARPPSSFSTSTTSSIVALVIAHRPPIGSFCIIFAPWTSNIRERTQRPRPLLNLTFHSVPSLPSHTQVQEEPFERCYTYIMHVLAVKYRLRVKEFTDTPRLPFHQKD